MAHPVFPHACDYGLSGSASGKMLTVEFGDGFAQDTPDGINNVARSWSVAFTRAPLDARWIQDELEGYLATGQRFLWTPEPGRPQVLVKVVGEVGYTRSTFGKSLVTATFKRVYEAM